jgi:hypothetical protein
MNKLKDKIKQVIYYFISVFDSYIHPFRLLKEFFNYLMLLLDFYLNPWEDMINEEGYYLYLVDEKDLDWFGFLDDSIEKDSIIIVCILENTFTDEFTSKYDVRVLSLDYFSDISNFHGKWKKVFIPLDAERK